MARMAAPKSLPSSFRRVLLYLGREISMTSTLVDAPDVMRVVTLQ
jgi:hypothetical protein